MNDPRIESFKRSLAKVLDHLHMEFSRLQTGRASSSLVDHAVVDAYGQKQELRTVAGVSIQDARTIVIQPWDKSIVGNVETALRALDLGTNPVNDGVVIRINLPHMTEERRKQLSKLVDQLAEEARIAVRQNRDEARESIKQDKAEDVRYTLLEELDAAAKDTNDKIEQAKKKKENEVMTV